MSAHFSVAETAEILDLPPSIVDKLVRSGQLPSNGSGVPAEEIQSYLSQSFIRLFQAQAKERDVVLPTPAAPAPAPTDESETLITRSIAEYERDMRGDTPELRIAPRYVPRRQLGGTFRQTRFTLLQLSTTGLRIRHDEALRPGDVARLALALLRPGRTFAMQARVVWTSIAQRGDGPSFCISGLRVIDPAPLQEVIQHLREARDLEPDQGRRRAANPSALNGLTDEDVASIIRAVRKFSADPVEAGRWYTRARFALADEDVKSAAPSRGRDREEVVGVWEYLDRRLDLGQVASVVSWLRQTRACAAEALVS
jgi:hypothetical protein